LVPGVPGVSYDTRAFEVAARLDADGRLTSESASRVCRMMDDHGFVVIPGLLSAAETARGLDIVKAAVGDPKREFGEFASQTDMRYGRRDFCPLASTPNVLDYAAMVCRRLESVLLEYSGRTRPVLEIATLTSYLGSSHQYIHRDPYGVIGVFVAVDDVSPEQGGTVFVPGTHSYSGAEMRHGGKIGRLMNLFRTRANIRILRYNLAKLWRLYRAGEPKITWREFKDRVFSRLYDNHQPNVLRFLLGKNQVFNAFMLGPRMLIDLARSGASLDGAFRLVQAAPAKGTVILYRSDMLHAGPDNRSAKPRYFLGLSLSRDIMFPKQWRDGYSPHATLLAQPKTLGDLLDMKPGAAGA
jgi:ectoine hydroxylase-related dioxygenase (phytanoyl-CoA dioxygenase family)